MLKMLEKFQEYSKVYKELTSRLYNRMVSGINHGGKEKTTSSLF